MVGCWDPSSFIRVGELGSQSLVAEPETPGGVRSSALLRLEHFLVGQYVQNHLSLATFFNDGHQFFFLYGGHQRPVEFIAFPQSVFKAILYYNET